MVRESDLKQIELIKSSSMPLNEKKEEINRVLRLMEKNKPISENERLDIITRPEYSPSRENLFANQYNNELPPEFLKWVQLYEKIKFLNNTRNVMSMQFLIYMDLVNETYQIHETKDFFAKFDKKSEASELVKKTFLDKRYMYAAVAKDEIEEVLQDFQKIKIKEPEIVLEESEETLLQQKMKSFMQKQYEADIYFEQLMGKKRENVNHLVSRQKKIRESIMGGEDYGVHIENPETVGLIGEQKLYTKPEENIESVGLSNDKMNIELNPNKTNSGIAELNIK
jgi:hypothetical protein